MVVYKITNTITKKIYVGQTTKTIEERWKKHLKSIFYDNLQTNLAKAVRHYGKNNFKIEILEKCKTKKELLEKEQFWIKKLNAIDKGYNMTPGGEGNNTYIAKTEKDMKKIKSKLSNSKLGDLNPMAKEIKAKNIETYEILYFTSLSEAQVFFNMNNHKFISDRINKKIKQPFRNKWLFAHKNEDFIEDYKNGGKGNKKRICIKIINTLTKETFSFKSINEAKKELKLSFKNINFSKSPNIINYKHYTIIKSY